MISRFTTVLLVCWSAPAPAEDLPPAGYFTGTYELIGRGPAPDFEPLSDIVTMQATNEDYPLNLSGCRLGGGDLSITPDGMEGGPPLIGHIGSSEIWCRTQSDGDNYPILSCYMEPADGPIPGLFTLWPSNNSPRPDTLKDCP